MNKLLILLLLSFGFGAIINVPDDYSTIQGGIDAASEGDTVLVAAGTYSSSTNSEVFPIEMASGIHLIGSGEDVSIIDAQHTDRVITMEYCDNNTISDLTLTGGLTDSYGGGIRLDYSDPILTHVTISNNMANWGGGMHSCDSNPTLTHVTISNNEALQGGAMRLIDSDIILTNVTISNNTASECGGMRLFGSNPILTHVTITGNTAEYYGGAMWLDYSNPTLTHVTISNNTAEYAGGGMRLSNSNPILTNVTIANNTAGIYGGGGMYLNSSNPNLTNSIMWGNSPESIYIGSGTPLITYSDIEGGWEGEGNIDDNPLFFDSEHGDYNLQEGSPCIDSGTVIEGMEYCGDSPDMGTYEYCEEEILTVSDIDGNIYQTVQIGEQLWMAENLKVTHYNNGDAITYITSEEQWGSMDEGQYGVYDDELTNANIYGNLYNWAVIGDIRGVCPEGWHVPSDDEYTVLTDFLGGESVAGGKMKEAGLEHWNYYSDQISLEATNESGFTGLPAGHRNTNTGDYIYMSFYGYFWSSTETSSDLAWRRYLFDYSSGVARDTFGKPNGFSIRCVTDDYILGDINGDEILNVLDIVLMINIILSNEYSVVADVNEDGSVDVLDVVLMVNILVGGLPQSN